MYKLYPEVIALSEACPHPRHRNKIGNSFCTNKANSKSNHFALCPLGCIHSEIANKYALSPRAKDKSICNYVRRGKDIDPLSQSTLSDQQPLREWNLLSFVTSFFPLRSVTTHRPTAASRRILAARRCSSHQGIYLQHHILIRQFFDHLSVVSGIRNIQ